MRKSGETFNLAGGIEVSVKYNGDEFPEYVVIDYSSNDSISISAELLERVAALVSEKREIKEGWSARRRVCVDHGYYRDKCAACTAIAEAAKEKEKEAEESVQ